jgi:hypothetical protein
MANINWDNPFTPEDDGPSFYIDPTNFQFTTAADPDAVKVPTYGLNGGPGYTLGEVGGSTLGECPQFVDRLDKLFFYHDRAYELNPQPILPDADLTLINGIVNMSDEQLADPEASFYGGIVTAALLFRLLVSDEVPSLSPIQIAFITQDALHNIGHGLAGLPPVEQAQALNLLGDVLSGAALSPFTASTTALGDTLAFTETNPTKSATQNEVLDLVTDHTGSHPTDHTLSALVEIAPPPPDGVLALLGAEQHISGHGHGHDHWLV